MGRRVIMGSEGPMGQVVFTCSVKIDDQPDRLVSIRTNPINACLAMKAWIDNYDGEWHVPSDDEGGIREVTCLWTIAIWDVTSMGEQRHAQVGAVSSTSFPNLDTAHTLSTMTEQYLDRLGM